MTDIQPDTITTADTAIATGADCPPVPVTPASTAAVDASSTVVGAQAQVPNPADEAASLARSGIPTEVLATLQAALQPVVDDIERQLDSYDATIKEWVDNRVRDCIADFAHRVEARFSAHDGRITANTGALLGAGIAVQGQPPAS